MSEDNSGGIGGAATEQASTPDGTPPPAAADFTSPDVYKQFVESLPEEVKQRNFVQTTKDLPSLVTRALGLESSMGTKRLETPSQNWTDDHWNNFYTTLRPESIDQYTKAEKLSLQLEGKDEAVEFDVDENSDAKLRQVAHDIGLTDRQFQKLRETWATEQVQALEAGKSQSAEATQNFARAVREEWGTKFDENMRSANETFDIVSQEIPELKQLAEDPVVANHPAIMKLFLKMAPMVQDQGLREGGMAGSITGETVAQLRSELQSLMDENSSLVFADPKLLKEADKVKRDRILARRSEIYSKISQSTV